MEIGRRNLGKHIEVAAPQGERRGAGNGNYQVVELRCPGMERARKAAGSVSPPVRLALKRQIPVFLPMGQAVRATARYMLRMIGQVGGLVLPAHGL